MNNQTFEQRAKDFLADIQKGVCFEVIDCEPGHDVHELKVGIGKHLGLVYKNGNVVHAKKAREAYDSLMRYFAERGYEPCSYGLLEVRFMQVGDKKGVIQDYISGPSLNDLHNYLVMVEQIRKRERKLKRPLRTEEIEEFKGRFTRDEASRQKCEQLLGLPQNRGISLEQITESEREFSSDIADLSLWVKSSNAIVLGQRRTKDLDRTCLAIIDY